MKLYVKSNSSKIQKSKDMDRASDKFKSGDDGYATFSGSANS